MNTTGHATDFDPKSYWESRLKENFDLRGVGDIGLPQSYNKCLYAIRRFAFRLAAKELRGHKELDVLDIGSGTGFYIQQWLEHGVGSLHGSDLTETAEPLHRLLTTEKTINRRY